MPLVEIWKKTPDQLRGKVINQVLVFAGDGKLKDGNHTSEEFREYLAHVSSNELSAYAMQCLESPFQDSGLALQDIVNQIGKRLGFKIENGRYRGTAGEIGFDGLWHTENGVTILVEVKTTDAYRLSLDTAADYRKELIKETRLSEDKSSILYVVGREDTGGLEAQVRGSRYAWDIRIISVEALLRLLRIKEETENQQTLHRIREILTPQEFTRVDGIIDLVFTATKDAKPDEEIPEAEPQEDKKKGKKFTPVNFRAACVDRLQKHFKETLVKQSPALHATPDGSMGVYVAISREFGSGAQTGYWFAFHPSQKSQLETYKTAWVTFGCGSERDILKIPFSEFSTWLATFNQTVTEEKAYWHVHISQDNGNWEITPKSGNKKISVTKYLLKG
ncbi:hypothetical protein [Opitutus sp. GAS368]|uniref:hypothetical protein n=1 Tax=Opitutus sp. GAS368 TaxID=1882749 RepID=UPI00155FA0C2|nr:hypothetical protein [Opitutus sp. GAS368]